MGFKRFTHANEDSITWLRKLSVR